MQIKHRVYVAGPYTAGDVASNVRMAIEAADAIAEAGGIPFLPHLSHFWHMHRPHDWEFWLEQDLAWLPLCDSIVRLPGESKGADLEMHKAREYGLVRFRSVEACVAWLKSPAAQAA